jgi:hypothetical protein
MRTDYERQRRPPGWFSAGLRRPIFHRTPESGFVTQRAAPAMKVATM